MDAMDTKEEDTSRNPKRQKIESEGQLVQNTSEDEGNQERKIIGPIFEVKEYVFADTPIDFTSQFRNEMELLEKYKETKDMTSEETLKLYTKVRKISSQDVSLIAIRDQDHNTLNLALETNEKVVEINMETEDIPILDMIHFLKQNRDILFTNLLKSTLKLSKLEATKRKIENQPRKEKVENKAH